MVQADQQSLLPFRQLTTNNRLRFDKNKTWYGELSSQMVKGCIAGLF